MSNNLKDYINKNRDAFDDETPGTRVWSNISTQLPGRKHDFQWLWKAAAVVFFASSIFLLVDKLDRSGNDVQPTLSTTGNEEFNQVEDFYVREISQKKELIQDMHESGVSVEAELQKLDAMYLVLKDQLKDNPSQEVIEALTLNLIVRLDLLNQVLEEVESQSDSSVKRPSKKTQTEI